MAITDSTAQAMLAYLQANYAIMCISQEAGSTTLATAIVAGTAPSGGALGIVGPAQAIALGQIYLDFNGSGAPPTQNGQQETLVTTGCAQGATSLPVTAIGGGVWTPAYSHAVGKTVVPVAPVTDNPLSAPANVQYLALAAGDFSAITGSGIGNRTVTITKKFPGATSNPSTITVVRVIKSQTWGTSGNVAVCDYIPQAVLSNTSGNIQDQTFTSTIKF